MTGIIVGVDAGGTRCRAVAWESIDSSRPLSTEKFEVTKHSSDTPGDFDLDYANLLHSIHELQDKYGPVTGIGLGIAGKANRDRTHLVLAGNLAHWVEKPIPKMLINEFDCPVKLGNDAEIAGIAEKLHGLTSHEPYNRTDFLEMVIASGIGGCVISHKKTSRKSLPDKVRCKPTELGHVLVDSSSSLTCAGCPDSPGHLEALCGGNNVPRRFGKTDIKDVTQDEWQIVLRDLIRGLESILAVEPVSLVVATGMGAFSRPWMLEEMERHFDQPRFESPKFRLSEYGADASTAGAHLLLAL